MENNKQEYILIPAYKLSISNWGALDMAAVKKCDCPIQRKTEQIPGDKYESSVCVSHFWKREVSRCPHFRGWGVQYGGRSQIECNARCDS
ncbi:hypothetical protein ABEV55_14690 [Aneurinibacillus thermoaerophilus]|uniref:hypothetical protein n=1 Tax=Aneurinibacillus thermoaerophilus TaxID=143495 RepID=UPI002E20CA71|nr:hypothetical protein [Aneurinibacillus thermoaerophilus]